MTGYAPSFVPLHFGCRTGGGHTIEAVIPADINPPVLGGDGIRSGKMASGKMARKFES